MKTKLSKTFLAAVLTSGMALGTGTSLVAQDQSMDKPSAGVSVQVDQAPPPEQAAPQYNAPQYSSPQYNAPPYNAQEQSGPQDVAPPPPQEQDQYQDQAQEPAPPPGPGQQQYTALPPEQLNKLVAPIALYPDSLVAQILAASQYPTQIVVADRMAKENPGLKGRALGQEVDQQDWDPSVKALMEFPSVLANLDRNLSWTSELGEAYQNQPDDVMQAVQYMRHKAYDAGNLRTTPQERVYEQGSDVDIQPADPNVVYVPTYNPAYVYGYPVGLWPGFYPWWGVGFGGPFISFGIGFPVWPFFGFGWGWHGWGIGWGFHGGVFFGGHPWGFRGGAFYNHAAFVHGNYRGFSSAHGAFGARGFNSAAGHGYAGASRGYGSSRSYAGASHGFAGSNRGAAVNRGAVGNRGYAGNRGFSGGERGFAGRGSSAPRAGSYSGSRGGESHGSSSRGGFGGSHGGGHSSGGHASGGHASGGGGGHSGGGHGGKR